MSQLIMAEYLLDAALVARNVQNKNTPVRRGNSGTVGTKLVIFRTRRA